MNNDTIQSKEKLESLGFQVDVSHDSDWDTYEVTAHFHDNRWAVVERHSLDDAMRETLDIVETGVYGYIN